MDRKCLGLFWFYCLVLVSVLDVGFFFFFVLGGLFDLFLSGLDCDGGGFWCFVFVLSFRSLFI